MSSNIAGTTRKSAFAGLAVSALALMAGCASQPSAQFGALAPELNGTPGAPAIVAAKSAPAMALSAAPTAAPAPATVPASGLQADAGPQADLMTLGQDAPAPLGFLKFCGRRPDQCGLNGAGDPDGLTKSLIAKYYWAVAFASPTRSSLSLTPASGQGQDNWGRPQASTQPYDWSTIFGPSVAAPAASAGRDASATVGARMPGGAAFAGRPSFLASAPAVRGAAPSHVEPLLADDGLMAELRRVNDRVNESIRYVPDMRQFGVDDFWTLPLDPGGSAAGDCKDYVLEKRRALINAGVPARDLSIAVVRTRWGEDHAVLLVATDKGELVLDSLSSSVVQWRRAPYSWIERQAPGQELAWVKILVDHHHADRPRQRVAAGAADQPA